MKHCLVWCIVIFFIASPLWPANRSMQKKTKSLSRLEHIAPDTYIQGEVIIKLGAARPAVLHKGRSGIPSLDAVLSTLVTPRLEPVFIGHTSPPEDTSLIDLSKYYEVHYSGPSDAVAIAKLLMRAEDVEFAEPRFRYKIDSTANDPLYPLQWHLPKIQAEAAWDITQGDSTVIIAIVDTGIDIDYQPDLKANIWNNPGETGLDALGNDKRFNGIDDDDDGYIDDWIGWDFYHPDNDPSPGNWHGTFLAGIAAAITNNNYGVAGVAPHCKLMAIKNGPDDPNSNEVWYGEKGIVYAADRGAAIINCSWSGAGFSQVIYDAITYAIQKGALVVAAAGNSANDIDIAVEYPASYDNVLSVAATGQTDQKSYFSNYGYTVAVSAPGEDVISTLPYESFGLASGTSVSAPIVSGIAALVKSNNKSLTPLQVGQQVRISADNINSSNPGYENQVGYGRVNAYRALTVQSPAIRMTSYTVGDSGTGNNDGIFNPKETIQINVTLTNFLQLSGNVTATLTSTSSFITIQNPSQQIGILGTLQSCQLPVPFRVTIGDNAPENQFIQCTLITSDGSYTDYNSVSFLVRSDISQHEHQPDNHDDHEQG